MQEIDEDQIRLSRESGWRKATHLSGRVIHPPGKSDWTMETFRKAADFVLHLNQHLDALAQNYGPWIYMILFLIIFCETGLVVTPFLPGDSLLFAVGALAAGGALKLSLILLLLPIAAILGDNTNYWLGYFLGPKIFQGDKVRLLNRKHLDRTHVFYEKHGPKTIIIARFMPIIRTFAPFVAGIGRMRYSRFLAYSIGGGVFWIFLITLAGYYFGNIPVVQKNFSLVILVIIILSILPAVWEFVRHRRSESHPL